MTQTPDITPEAVEQHCRDIHDAVTANELYAPHGVAWQSAMRALSARVRELEAAADDDALTVAHLKGYADGRRAAEAKLAKAMEALEIGMTCTEEHGGAAKFLRIARTTLAELNGENK
jgi:hypothetical protein